MTETTAPDQRATCPWSCGDTTPRHSHFTVIVREGGRLLGRLCPDGTATTRKIHAAILSRAKADEIAAAINDRGEFTAHVAPF